MVRDSAPCVKTKSPLPMPLALVADQIIMDDMTPFFIDGHLDLAYLALNGRDMLAEPPHDAAVTLPTLARGDVRIAFATIFTEPGCAAPEGYASSDDRAAAFNAGKR